MPYEHKEGRGNVFPNDRKTQDNQPDFKGQAKFNGELVEIALWVKEGQKGRFFSVEIAEPRQREAAPQKTDAPIRKQGAPQDDFDKFMGRPGF